MISGDNLSFDNTEIAFRHKNDKQLRKSAWLFGIMNRNWLVKIGTYTVPLALKLHLPVKGIIRQTIFSQFCGGETLEESGQVINSLAKYGVETILDYGIEAKDNEVDFEKTTASIINSIKYAGAQKNIPFVSIKVTGIARFELLQKMHEEKTLTENEIAEYKRVVERMHRVCSEAASSGISIMIDAEESWIQNPLDKLAEELAVHYNTDKAVVINTIQLYRTDRFAYLKESFARMASANVLAGFKIVRGAYMEKERKRAKSLSYESPIQPCKENTDRDYNLAIDFCLSNIDKMLVCVATHNEYSNKKAADDSQARGMPSNHPHLHFSQLYGMSDHISFNLAHSGFHVTKYLPYGPVHDVVPYLLRRAQENTSVAGMTSRELLLIKKELKRRKAP